MNFSADLRTLDEHGLRTLDKHTELAKLLNDRIELVKNASELNSFTDGDVFVHRRESPLAA